MKGHDRVDLGGFRWSWVVLGAFFGWFVWVVLDRLQEMAQAELHRFEQGVMEERNQRDKEVQEKKILVEQRVEPLGFDGSWCKGP